MSGFGVRFRSVGYDIPKPLIIVEYKPIIVHVIDMFPDLRFYFHLLVHKKISSTE